MFENKKEPQDIFEGVEPPANLPVEGGAAAPTPQPRPPLLAPEPTGKIVSDADLGTGGHLWKTILIIVIAFLVLGLVALFAYKFVAAPTSSNKDETSQNGQTAGDDDEVVPDGKGGELEDEDPAAVQDSDGDGLTNAEEIAAGTSVSKADTDSDGLGDREEVQVYGTDPRRADTDGDSYTDGVEVRGGYNPNGPGKILELPVQ
jgi:hypothetical protein